MKGSVWRREAMIAALLLGFGVVILPSLVYLVGIVIVEPYEGENGLATLYGSILSGLVKPELPAWLLVLGPYVVIQLVRLALVGRGKRQKAT